MQVAERELGRRVALDRFDALAQQKSDLLTQLGHITGIAEKSDADALDSQWDGFKARMQSCRQLHQRNEILLIRKLDAIRGTLHTLRGAPGVVRAAQADRSRIREQQGGRQSALQPQFQPVVVRVVDVGRADPCRILVPGIDFTECPDP